MVRRQQIRTKCNGSLSRSRSSKRTLARGSLCESAPELRALAATPPLAAVARRAMYSGCDCSS